MPERVSPGNVRMARARHLSCSDAPAPPCAVKKGYVDYAAPPPPDIFHRHYPPGAHSNSHTIPPLPCEHFCGVYGEPAVGSMSVVRDFTLEKYRHLYRCLLDRGYAPVTLSGYLLQPDPERSRCVILRHDVDLFPSTALRMATLERDLGIQASYYFRYPFTFHPPTIRSIAALGHEVGYHYEVLTKTRGDLSRAVRLFGEELAAFRAVCPVTTVAAHGGSRSPYDNRDIWNRCRFRDFDLLGEAYLSIPEFLYFTDTGRTWSPRGTVRDCIPGGRAVPDHVRSTGNLMEWIGATDEKHLSLNAHPLRWTAGVCEEVFAAGGDFLYNMVKRSIRGARSVKKALGKTDRPGMGG